MALSLHDVVIVQHLANNKSHNKNGWRLAAPAIYCLRDVTSFMLQSCFSFLFLFVQELMYECYPASTSLSPPPTVSFILETVQYFVRFYTSLEGVNNRLARDESLMRSISNPPPSANAPFIVIFTGIAVFTIAANSVGQIWLQVLLVIGCLASSFFGEPSW